MHGADAGDDADQGPGERRQASDLAGPLHPHLEDGHLVLRPEPEQGEREARLGVQVARRLEHAVADGEDRGDHLLGGGLAVAPGDADNRRRDPVQNPAGQVVEGFPGVRDLDQRGRPGDLDRPLGNHAGGFACDGVRREEVTVGRGAPEREEEAARDHLTGIRVVAVELRVPGPAGQPAAGGL